MISPRAKGLVFEKKVRTNLESKGWSVSKFMNNVDLDYRTKTVGVKLSSSNNNDAIGTALNPTHGRMIPAKGGYWRLTSTGFPDFIAFKYSAMDTHYVSGKHAGTYYEVIGVECKMNGYLSKEEREKCVWLLLNNIFSKILIASKNKINRGKIVYKEFVKTIQFFTKYI